MGWRNIVLILLAVALTAGVVLGWGSAGSALCAFCLITMGAALLIKRFLIDREDGDFEMDNQ